MQLNFESDELKKIAKGISSSQEHEYKELHKPEEAFMLLIKGLKQKDLDNLCKILARKGRNVIPFEVKDWYEITQGEGAFFKCPSTMMNLIYASAKECLKEGRNMGNARTPDGRFNTSSWISHSLYEAQLAGNLARLLRVDRSTAETLGILHDIGRKYNQSFLHVVIGFKVLIKKGWTREAPIAITHSFLNGKRCANCDPAEPGFSLDENGEPHWDSEESKDDVAGIIESYVYNIYDDIINISDLMATDSGIVSPLARVEDIATRKKPDQTNRPLFLSEYINKLNEFLVIMGHVKKCEKVSARQSIDELWEQFKHVSELFYKHYLNDIEKLDKEESSTGER